jgi:hypothetical protein
LLGARISIVLAWWIIFVIVAFFFENRSLAFVPSLDTDQPLSACGLSEATV